jgi:hypothetical protein
MVFEAAEGRQYVRDGEGGKMYGTWLPPKDEPDAVV